jgi:hypothetical protein
MPLLIVVPWGLALAVLQAPSDAAAFAARDRSELAAMSTASGHFAPLGRSTSVTAHRVEDLLAEWAAKGSPPPGESLGLAARFRILDDVKPLGAASAERLRSLLRSKVSYNFGVRSACMFSPAVAFTFPSRDDLLVLVCFHCREIAFARGETLLDQWSLSDEGAQGLLDLAHDLFPDLPKTLVP